MYASCVNMVVSKRLSPALHCVGALCVVVPRMMRDVCDCRVWWLGCRMPVLLLVCGF